MSQCVPNRTTIRHLTTWPDSTRASCGPTISLRSRCTSPHASTAVAPPGLPDDALSACIREYTKPLTSNPLDTHVEGPSDAGLPPEFARHPRYEIRDRLGAGGMGIVYRALQRNMDRLVAVKVLHERLTNRPGFGERFQQEVKALARLNHPNVVSAFDADRAGDSHFLVMEYVEGEALDAVVRRRGPLPVDEACRLIAQAASGLHHAHEREMTHRDIEHWPLMLSTQVSSGCGLQQLGSEEDLKNLPGSTLPT